MNHNRYASMSLAIRPLALLAAVVLGTFLGCSREPDDPASASGVSISGERDASPQAQPKKFDRVNPVVRIDTNKGAITIRLDAAHAPGTVRNFLNYVNDGFYDNTLIHYVHADKMVVAGGYTADRALKPTRGSIRNEAHNGLKNVRGSVAMARDQSLIDSATSQFFINLADAPQRDHQGDTAPQYGYCVFGEVTEGLDVAESISRSATTDLGADLAQTPDPPVVISSVRVIQ